MYCLFSLSATKVATNQFLQCVHNDIQKKLKLDWTGLLDSPMHLIQCRTEAKHTYYFAAPYSVLPGVSRGQRSRAY